jgi:hypothetical protein
MPREYSIFILQHLPILIGSLGGNEQNLDRLKAQKKLATVKTKPKVVSASATLAKRER